LEPGLDGSANLARGALVAGEWVIGEKVIVWGEGVEVEDGETLWYGMDLSKGGGVGEEEHEFGG